MIGLLLLLPLFSGCNDSDDVAAIFTGKTWKLNYITVDGDHEMFDFWGNDNAARTKSYGELKQNGSYNLVFNGITKGYIISGSITGTIFASFPLNDGTWRANGKNNEFNASVSGNDGGDQLAKSFLEGLNQASSYEGDNKNLYLLYNPKNSKRTFRMVFYAENSK